VPTKDYSNCLDAKIFSSRAQQCPAIPKLNCENIPQLLIDLDQWVLWSYVPPRGTGDKWVKLPRQINNLNAKSNDPTTWSSFGVCLQTLIDRQLNRDGLIYFDGIGFCLSETDRLTVIDIDHCYSEDGQLENWAQEIFTQFIGTYIEASPSGNGLHIWCLGKPLKTGEKKWNKKGTDKQEGIEVYAWPSRRYMTVTGDAINHIDITDQQAALDWLCQRYWTVNEIKPPVRAAAFSQFINRFRGNARDQTEEVLKALKKIPAACGYNTWLRVGMALKQGGYPLEMWDTWSQDCPAKYSPGECHRKWRSL
jgi:hypothetical protein